MPSNVTLNRTSQNELELVASCAQIAARASELSAWTRRVEERGCTLGPARQAGARCTQVVTDCVPNHVREFHGLKATQQGPNCFNHALVIAGVLPGLRNSTQEELQFYLTNLCRPVPAGEPAKAGDIGLILDRRESPPWFHHAYVHISEALAYSKNSQDPSDPYAVQAMAPMKARFNVQASLRTEEQRDAEALRIQKQTGREVEVSRCGKVTPVSNSSEEGAGEDSDNCGTLETYRCMSYDEYFANVVTARRTVFTKTIDQIEELECLTQKAVFSPSGFSEPITGLLSSGLEALTTYLRQNAGQWPQATAEEKQLLKTLDMRIEAIYTTYGMNKRDRTLLDFISKARHELSAR